MLPPPLMVPSKRRVRRKRRRVRSGPSLTLVSAEYPIEIEGAARLRFDRAVNIDAFDGTQVIVKDGLNQASVMNATGPVELSDPQTVTVFLVIIGPYAEPNML